MSDNAFVVCLNILSFCAGMILGIFWDEIGAWLESLGGSNKGGK